MVSAFDVHPTKVKSHQFIPVVFVAAEEELSRVDEEFKGRIQNIKSAGSQIAIMEQNTNLIIASLEAILVDG